MHVHIHTTHVHAHIGAHIVYIHTHECTHILIRTHTYTLTYIAGTHEYMHAHITDNCKRKERNADLLASGIHFTIYTSTKLSHEITCCFNFGAVAAP